MTILQLFFNKSYNPPSGIYATGGNFVEIAPSPPGVVMKRHVFTGPGTFTITAIPAGISVNYLVVGGGGGGGTDNISPPVTGGAGAGGGAGGFRTGTFPVSVGSYPVVIGAGGAGGTPTLPSYGANGGSSNFSTVVAGGGGGGAALSGFSPGLYQGSSGASGGGSRRYPSNGTPEPQNYVLGGASNDPTQGFQGAGVPTIVSPFPAPYVNLSRYYSGFNGAGGGGATSPGIDPGGQGWPWPPTGPFPNGYKSIGGEGGLVPFQISPDQHGTFGPNPSGRYYAGGGSGGLCQYSTGGPPSGGGYQIPMVDSRSAAGGGGRHGIDLIPTNPGTVNTGGGGGGYGGGYGVSGGSPPGTATGGSGGPGIVIISYPW